MVFGPLGDGADEAGPTVAEGIAVGQYKTFEVARPADGVLELVLCRPEAYNSMSSRLIRELHQVCDVLQYPLAVPGPLIKVLIIRGTGRGFCAGYDFKDRGNSRSDKPYLQHAFSSLMRKLRDIPQPIICGVNGVAAGGGMSFALAADVRVGAPACRFVASFVKLGLGGGELGTSYFLPRIVGRERAASMLLTGREIDGATAERWGLISQLVQSEEELATACRKFAEEMLTLSPKGLRYTKWLLNNSQEMSLHQALDREDLAQQFMVTDPESQEVGMQHVRKFSGGSSRAKL